MELQKGQNRTVPDILLPGIHSPRTMSAEAMASSLVAHGYSPPRRRESLAAKLLSAARIDGETYSVDRGLVHIKNQHPFWKAARSMVARRAFRDFWGTPVDPRTTASSRFQFHDVPKLSDATSGGPLDVTPAMLREVLALANAETILADGELLVLSFMLASNFTPAGGAACSAGDLALEIERNRASRRPPMQELESRLRAAAREMEMFSVSLIKRRISLLAPPRFEDALADILTRPLIQRRIDEFRRRERSRALEAEPKPQAEPKPPREVREKLPEMNPPPFVHAEVHFVGVTETELLHALDRATIPCAQREHAPVRPGHARACAERFSLRNGLVDLGLISMGSARYLVVRLGLTVQADERSDGETILVVGDEGGEPDESLDMSGEPEPMEPSRGQVRATADMSRFLSARTQGAIDRAAQPLLREISVRHAHAHAQTLSRFAAPAAVRALAPGARDAEIARVAAERDEALEALRGRFAAHVRCTRITCSWVTLPAAMISVALRRRKTVRTIALRVPAGAKSIDKLCCEACGGLAMAKPAVCEGQMHLLCETCVPTAQGRIACPVCG